LDEDLLRLAKVAGRGGEDRLLANQKLSPRSHRLADVVFADEIGRYVVLRGARLGGVPGPRVRGVGCRGSRRRGVCEAARDEELVNPRCKRLGRNAFLDGPGRGPGEWPPPLPIWSRHNGRPDLIR